MRAPETDNSRAEAERLANGHVAFTQPIRAPPLIFSDVVIRKLTPCCASLASRLLPVHDGYRIKPAGTSLGLHGHFTVKTPRSGVPHRSGGTKEETRYEHQLDHWIKETQRSLNDPVTEYSGGTDYVFLKSTTRRMV